MKKLLLSTVAIFSFILSQAQLPNPGFETWARNTFTNTPEEPTGYLTYNIFKASFIDPANPTCVYKDSTLVHGGNYSMKVVTAKLHTNPQPGVIPDTSGVAATGAIGLTPNVHIILGYPSTTKFQNLTFWGAAAPVGNDVGYAVAVLTKWRGTYRDTIAIASTPFATSPSFVQYTVPFTYYDCCTTPDTASVFFSSSTKIGAKIGSTIWVDDAALTGVNGIEEAAGSVPFQLFPNPANSIVNINTLASKVSEIVVTDISGRTVSSTRVTEDKITLDVASLPAGMYFYAAFGADKKQVTQGKFSVTR